jgi:hypothetical protein
MRIPVRMAAWVCIGSLMGFGAQVRAEDMPAEAKHPRAQLEEQPCSEEAPCELGSPERRQLVGDVAEYTYQVRVGQGAHDFITLHRVVREPTAGTPLRTSKSVFLVHGDVWGFRNAFLASASSQTVDAKHSIALFLAQHNVDVWGLDERWVHVPADTTDFSFMKDWNLGLHARDVGTGLALARAARAYTGNGVEKMVLLGWSRGATVSYAYLNAETQLRPEYRQVSGFIPVDMAYKLAPDATAERNAACTAYAALARLQAAGQYEGGKLGVLLQNLGMLALAQPDEASPIPPLQGLTNRQGALLFGGATYLLQNPAVIPAYHWTGAQWSYGFPTALKWTGTDFFFDNLAQASPYQSIGEQVDTLAMWCGAPDVPYDDHLREVTVPVFYVGAAGGSGTYGLHSLSLLGSTDRSSLVVSSPVAGTPRAEEYGHVDLFLANDAESRVWAPILDWVQRH